MTYLENFRLVVFRAVAEHLSFRKAAEELYLTQPAVSQQIKALEEDLGVLLFDRSGTQARLTPTGEVLVKYARLSNELLVEAEHEVSALAGTHAGLLSLGASTTIAQYVLPSILGDFCKLNPRIHPTLISGNTEQVVEAVQTQKVQLGFIEGPARSREIQSEPFLNDELVLIVPAAHEWSERQVIDPGELAAVPLLLRERGSGTRRIIELALERHGIKKTSLRVAMELDSTEAIKSAVEAGLGAGILSKWAIAKDTRLGSTFRIVEIRSVRFPRQFLIIERKGPRHQDPASEFRRFVLARISSKVSLPRPAAIIKASDKAG
jgi:LysR family transcriptional regulator, transcriptional activator of the cysJI operon